MGFKIFQLKKPGLCKIPIHYHCIFNFFQLKKIFNLRLSYYRYICEYASVFSGEHEFFYSEFYQIMKRNNPLS